jgi:HSP20 family protein
MWAPAVDIRETKDNLILTFEVPAIRDKDVNLSITDDVLTVQGERRFDYEGKEESTTGWNADTASSSATFGSRCPCSRTR